MSCHICCLFRQH